MLGGCEGRLDCNCYPAIGGDGEMCGGGGGGRGAGCHSGGATFRLSREKVNFTESFLNILLIEYYIGISTIVVCHSVLFLEIITFKVLSKNFPLLLKQIFIAQIFAL